MICTNHLAMVTIEFYALLDALYLNTYEPEILVVSSAPSTAWKNLTLRCRPANSFFQDLVGSDLSRFPLPNNSNMSSTSSASLIMGNSKKDLVLELVPFLFY